jgi:hypothetical protein
MDLTGLKIFDISGTERIPLQGDFSADSLSDRLIQEWIPYFECHRCGRFDYCKFVERYPEDPMRAVDIKCGVFATIVRRYTEAVFNLLEDLDSEQRQKLLDTAFHIGHFVYESELTVGRLMSESHLQWWGDWAPALFGSLPSLREHLNSAASAMATVEQLHSVRAVLFVEGRSEKALLDELRRSHETTYIYLVVEEYEGTGNRRPKRIESLLRHYQTQGYRVLIEGDADGRPQSIFQSLVKKGIIEEPATFVFRRDLESGVPPALMHRALTDLGLLPDVSEKEYLHLWSNSDGSFWPFLEQDLQLADLPDKVSVARAVGCLLNDPWWDYWNDEEFLSSELGEFLVFIEERS